MIQLRLPAMTPVRGIAAPPRDEAPRLKRSCALILGRLQQGPASNLDLMRCGGGIRYGARIHELRARGHRISVVDHDKVTGRVVYRLEVP
jgi:hypothetical protein